MRVDYSGRRTFATQPGIIKMQVQTQPHASNITAAIRAAYPETAPPPVFTVAQFAKRNPAFTEAALRNLIFKAEERHSSKGPIAGNGLIEAGAIIRCGRKVLLSEPRFFAWLDSSQTGGQK